MHSRIENRCDKINLFIDPYRRVCECSSELIKIGTDVTEERDNFPKITFNICLSGTKRILDFIMESIVKLSWDELPIDDFLLTVDFFCMWVSRFRSHYRRII